MPWRECGPMEERVRFVSAAERNGGSFKSLCDEFGISRKTGYKWLSRFEEGGFSALDDNSRRPMSSPTRTANEIEEKILKWRSPDGWGARKIAFLLWEEGIQISIATVHRVLARTGMIHKIDAHQPALKRFERAAPNELVQVDFKGPMGMAGARSEPLTMLDDHSRFALGVFAVRDHKFETVLPYFIDTFKRYGVPQEMLLDHGTPWWNNKNGWGLTKLAAFLMKQDIKLVFSGIRHPQTQGKIERFHRTLERSVKKQGAPTSHCHWQSLYDGFVQRYNFVRPHDALGMKRPIERYQPSERKFQPSPERWKYPEHMILQTLDAGGFVRINAKRFFVCEALAHEEVGVELLHQQALVAFRGMYLREICCPTGLSSPLVCPVGQV